MLVRNGKEQATFLSLSTRHVLGVPELSSVQLKHERFDVPLQCIFTR